MKNKLKKDSKNLIKKPIKNKVKHKHFLTNLNKEKLSKKIYKYKANKQVEKTSKQEILLSKATKLDKFLYCKTKFIRIKYKNFVSFIKNFIINNFGYSIFTVSGLNKTKLLNSLRKSVSIIDAKIDKNLTFRVSNKNSKIVKEILESFNYKYSYSISSNLYNFLLTVFNKKTLTFFTILISIFYLYSNLLVLKIDINYKQNEVSKLLKNEGIKIGCKISKIDTYNLERIIVKNCDISFCDIKVIGNTLKVNITKSEAPEISFNNNIDSKVIATTDCLLYRQLIYSGTPTKKFGDIIKKGDILIENNIMLDENNNLKVFALGDVYGLIQKGKEVVINKKCNEKVLTGKKKSVTRLSFSNNFINSKSPYKYYKVSEKLGRVSDILPIYYKTTTYYEQRVQNVTYTKNDIVKKFVHITTNELLATIPFKATYKRSFFFIDEKEDKFILRCYIEYEDKVSTLSS